jgi:purine-cytosine permease-like protein
VVPLWALYLAIGLVFIPLTWWGLTIMNWVMWATLPIYLGFLGWTISLAATNGAHVDFWGYHPGTPTSPAAGPALLQVCAAVLALITQATIAADVGRFIPAQKRTGGAFAVGFVSQLLTFVGVTMLGAWLTLRLGGNTNPGAYLAGLLGVWGVFFVMITQIRINVTNVYSGSLAYANFFCRVFHLTPGRQYWVVLTSALGTALMFGGIFNHLNAVLTFEGVFVMAWVMAIVADITVNKRLLHLSPENFMYKRAQTYRYNPVGTGALLLALVVGVPLAFGAAGELGKTLAPFVSGAIAFVVAPILAVLTRGRYYEPRTVAVNIDPALPPLGAGAESEVRVAAHEQPTERCVKCGRDFELAEYVSCPFLDGPICSVCCAAEAHCGERCKDDELVGRDGSDGLRPGATREERSWRAVAATGRSS